MPLRTSWEPEEPQSSKAAPAAASRVSQRTAKTRAIAATARILQPTQSSMARSTTKRLTRDAKERVEARNVERKRRELARVAKHNGRLTVPKSPKFHAHPRKKPSAALLTMTSRELLEIEAIKKRVQETRKKVRKYHEATTRSVLSSSTSNASSSKSSFAMALRSCGSLGVPAVRRAKLTEPIGFDFEIDKRLAQRKRASTSGSSSTSTSTSTSSSAAKVVAAATARRVKSSAEPLKKRLRV